MNFGFLFFAAFFLFVGVSEAFFFFNNNRGHHHHHRRPRRRQRQRTGVVTGLIVIGNVGFGGGRGFGRRRRNRCNLFGCRGKRSLLDDPTSSSKINFIESIFLKIELEDRNDCGCRLLCELSQKDEEKLTRTERTILSPYSGEPSDGSIYGHYNEAVWWGKKIHLNCEKIYRRCLLSADEQMDQYQESIKKHSQ